MEARGPIGVIVQLDYKGSYSRYALTPEEFEEEFGDVEDMPRPEAYAQYHTTRPMVHLWYMLAAVFSEDWKEFFSDMGSGLCEGDVKSGNLAYIDWDSMGSLGKWVDEGQGAFAR